ncbi:polysaccharide lyase [Streptomyces filamentosus]|uniref:polysaccharide lyase n=1 Tax=Streptomyces filamentosus TaxID=67294 RepID=UPI0037CE723F
MPHRKTLARRALPLVLAAGLSPLAGLAGAGPASADTVVRATYEDGRLDSGYPGIRLDGCCAHSLTLDANLTRTGKGSLRSRLKYGDPQAAGGPRAESEAVGLTPARFRPGDRFWYGFSVYIPSTWQDDTVEDIVFQWHHTKSSCDDPNRSPAMFLVVMPPTSTAPSRLRLRVNSDPVLCDHRDHASAHLLKTSHDLVPLTKGVWHDLVLRVEWAHTATGSLRAWHRTDKSSGWTQVLAAEGVANTYHDDPATFGYLQWGIYKPAWRTGPSAVPERNVWHDNVAVAPDSPTGMQDVDPSS